MAPSKDRQRRLARAKFDRQMARRAVRERKRRRVLAGAGTALAVVLVAVGGAWIGGAFDSKENTAAEAPDICLWSPRDVSGNTALKDVGTPPTKDLPQTGTETMTIDTNQGAAITATLDVTSAPCGAANFSYLAGKKFFDGTDCHEILDIGAVHCGDPSGTGQGGPAYSYYDENLPVQPEPAPSPSAAAKPAVLYPTGTVATVGSPAGSNGSQFLIFFKDYAPTTDPVYSIVGQVTGGQDTLAKIGKIPTVTDGAGEKVKPKEKITIKSLTVAADTAAAAPTASAQS
ncbi:peptidyl-prolyl cis-trans isomerase (rotamase) [Actinoplanes cyaneus]|uniref:Peptidyl-prolyl cis-trans isomerase (Rotamase) n=1 Tax=Actinoplanes cyaneus TaxID=52696 RepID=A0A919M168_9ACTN|nr:peptidylprolyl isomerase [Actinoplanes cyaneus]MCW2139355.1 peptidyl-prolyl cis-trans isomerase B (cyclophilin B) [Actinoplanes cyaneus]GID65885.1 peptidyl-prolyl cis-trans isomerase (rotamase) [Actinoplanes cyaneus]